MAVAGRLTPSTEAQAVHHEPLTPTSRWCPMCGPAVVFRSPSRLVRRALGHDLRRGPSPHKERCRRAAVNVANVVGHFLISLSA
jgi:hypothetical protein